MYNFRSLTEQVSPNLRKMIGNTGWLLTERLLHLIVGMAVGVWVARYLGPSQFGAISYAIAFVAIFSPFTTLGLQGVVVRDIVKHPEEAEEILGTTFALKLAGAISGFLLILCVITLVHENQPIIRSLGLILAAGLVFRSFGVVDLWYQSQVRSKYTVLAQITGLLSGTAAKIVLILTGASVVAFAWVTTFEALVVAIALLVAYQVTGKSINLWKFRWARAKSLLSQSWPLVIASLGAVLNLDIDKIMLGRIAGDSQVGVYSAAAKLSEIWYFLPIAIVSSAFPALVRSMSLDDNLYKQRLQKLYDLMVWLALTAAILISSVSGPLVGFLYGKGYEDASVILSVHVWAGLFTFMGAVLSKWLINEGLLKFSFIRHGFGAVVNIALNLFLIPKYGGLGAAFATLVSYATASWLACFTDRRTFTAGKMMALALIVPIRVIIGKRNRM